MHFSSVGGDAVNRGAAPLWAGLGPRRNLLEVAVEANANDKLQRAELQATEANSGNKQKGKGKDARAAQRIDNMININNNNVTLKIPHGGSLAHPLSRLLLWGPPLCSPSPPL
nr:uncharacterized protein LOC101030116 [Saimiri boliviensis boliviensis]